MVNTFNLFVHAQTVHRDIPIMYYEWQQLYRGTCIWHMSFKRVLIFVFYNANIKSWIQHDFEVIHVKLLCGST